MNRNHRTDWLFEPTSIYTLLLTSIICGFIILEAYFPGLVAFLSSKGFHFVENLKFFPDESMNFVVGFIEWFGVLYGFLLPLLLVRAWEQFDSIDREFDREADTIKIMYEDILLFRKEGVEFKNKIFNLLINYIDHVIEHHAAEAETDSAERARGDGYLRDLRKEYYDLFHPSKGKKKETDILSSEMLRQLNRLIDVRGDRISLSNQRLFESLRFVALITSVIFAIPFYFVKFHPNQSYGFLDSVLVFGVIFLVIFLLTTIEDLDEPFIGSWQISTEPWQRLRKEIESSLTEPDGH